MPFLSLFLHIATTDVLFLSLFFTHLAMDSFSYHRLVMTK